MLLAAFVAAGLVAVVWRGERANRRLRELMDLEAESPEQLPRQELAANQEIGSYMMSADEVTQLVRAVLNFSDWMHRRVEVKTFVDDARISHHTSLDFTVPDFDFPRSNTDPGMCLVPLTFMEKGKLRTFDLRDEQGIALPALTRYQNANITAGCLAVLYGQACQLAQPRLEPDRNVIALLATVALADPQPAADTLEQLTQAKGIVSADQARAIKQYPPLRDLLFDSALGFLLLTHVKAHVGDRRIVKLSYVESFRAIRPAKLLRRAASAVGRWLGWMVNTFEFDASGIGSAQSYHFEMSMPSDIYVRSAKLRRLKPSATSLDQEEFVLMTHLNAAGQIRGAVARVNITFRLRASMLWPGFLISAATTLLLAIGILLREADFHARFDAALAIAVAVPGLFGAYTLATEHRLTRRVAAGSRAGAQGSVLLSFIAAGTLAITAPLQLPQISVAGLIVLGPAPLPTNWRLLLWTALSAFSLLNFLTAAVGLGRSVLAERLIGLG